MAKKPATKSTRRAQPKPPAPPRTKLFRPKSWYDSSFGSSAGDYVAHALVELGRLGYSFEKFESDGVASYSKSVLSDLIEWMSTQPNDAYANLCDWLHLDFDVLGKRLKTKQDAKPRIEVSAFITTKDNLSVRWHPRGWRDAPVGYFGDDRGQGNHLNGRRWAEPPDFRWFRGDEPADFIGRASNELMFIRGVGDLRPQPRKDYWGSYNRDVLDSILICAVRAAYESLIRHLQLSFEVRVVNAFEFETRDEIDDIGLLQSRTPTHRVVSWTLEDADDLNARRERAAAEEQERTDRAEFDNLEEAFGFSVDRVADAISRACAPKATGAKPSAETADRNAAKELRTAGFKIDAGQVRRIRKLIERYRPDVLPEGIKPEPARDEAQPAPPPDNIVQFPDKAE